MSAVLNKQGLHLSIQQYCKG